MSSSPRSVSSYVGISRLTSRKGPILVQIGLISDRMLFHASGYNLVKFSSHFVSPGTGFSNLTSQKQFRLILVFSPLTKREIVCVHVASPHGLTLCDLHSRIIHSRGFENSEALYALLQSVKSHFFSTSALCHETAKSATASHSSLISSHENGVSSRLTDNFSSNSQLTWSHQ